jgi:hypothetical protein
MATVMAAAGGLLAVAASGCFSPQFEACAVSCGEASACPDDQLCLSDGKCHATQDEPLCSLPGEDGSIADGSVIGEDGGRPDAADPDGGGDPPDAAVDAGPPVTPTRRGDLVISEIHKDPSAAPDPAGEWFEVFNPTASTFDLSGLLVSDLGSESFEIDETVILPPGGRTVFARLASSMANGGVAVDFTYGILFSLGNTDDEIVIENLDSGTILDSVFFDTDFPDTEGASISLDPDEHDAMSNDDAASWCDGQTPYGDGDLGTPGRANPQC